MSPGMNYNVRLKKVKNSYRALTEVKIKREKKYSSKDFCSKCGKMHSYHWNR